MVIREMHPNGSKNALQASNPLNFIVGVVETLEIFSRGHSTKG